MLSVNRVFSPVGFHHAGIYNLFLQDVVLFKKVKHSLNFVVSPFKSPCALLHLSPRISFDCSTEMLCLPLAGVNFQLHNQLLGTATGDTWGFFLVSTQLLLLPLLTSVPKQNCNKAQNSVSNWHNLIVEDLWWRSSQKMAHQVRNKTSDSSHMGHETSL